MKKSSSSTGPERSGTTVAGVMNTQVAYCHHTNLHSHRLHAAAFSQTFAASLSLCPFVKMYSGRAAQNWM